MTEKNYKNEGEVQQRGNEHRKDNRGYYSLFSPLLSLFDDGYGTYSSSSNLLKTDISENEKDYLFEVDVPGVKKSDITINLNKGYLEIGVKVNREDNSNSKDHKHIHSERFYGNYSRSYFVGYDVKKTDISAKLNDGVLNVIVKKPVEEKTETNSITIE